MSEQLTSTEHLHSRTNDHSQEEQINDGPNGHDYRFGTSTENSDGNGVTVDSGLPSSTDTQFQGLIDLVNARAEDLEKSVKSSPVELKEVAKEALSDDAREAIEKTYRDFNELIEQQKTLQSKQSVLHESLIERERSIDRREREVLEQRLGLERELRESERVRHGYEKRLQIVAEREATLEYQKQNIDNTLKSKLAELSVKLNEEFNERCAEAEREFETRHALLEARYTQKRDELKQKIHARQQQVEHEIATKVELIESALIDKLERQRRETSESINETKQNLSQQEFTLQALYNDRLNELLNREQELEQRRQELSDQIRSDFDKIKAEREALDAERALLLERSAQIKASGTQFKTLLDEAKVDRELQQSLKEALLAEQKSVQDKLVSLDAAHKALEQRRSEVDSERESNEIYESQLVQRERELDEKQTKISQELQEARESRERATKYELKAKAVLEKYEAERSLLAEREEELSTLQSNTKRRDEELSALITAAQESRESAKRDQEQTTLLKEDAQRLHEMRSDRLEEAEAEREKARQNAAEVRAELEELRGRRAVLETKLKETENERRNLELGQAELAQEQEEVDREYKEAMSAVQQQSLSLEEVRERLEEREARLEERENKLALKERSAQELFTQINQRDQKLKELEEEMEEREETSLQREREALELHRTLRVREEKLLHERSELEEREVAIENAQSSLKMDLAALEIERAGLSGLSERARELDERARQIESKRASLEDERRELKRSSDQLLSDRERVRAQTRDNQAILDQAKAIESGLSSREAKLAEELKSLEEQRGLVALEYGKLSQQRRDLELDQELFNTERDELESLKQKIENDRFEMDSLQREIEESHELNLKLIEERARLEEGLSRVEEREMELNQREELLTQKEENMWQLESDVAESLEEAKERDKWSQSRLSEAESREKDVEQRLHALQTEMGQLRLEYQAAVRAEESMRSQVSGVEATAQMLQDELEDARARFDRAENENRELIKRNTQLEIEIKSKTLVAHRAEEALIKARDGLELKQDLAAQLEEARESRESAEALRAAAERERDELLQQRREQEIQQKTLEAKTLAISQREQELDRSETEIKGSLAELLKRAEEDREIAESERRAAEASRKAAEADRQVAQRARRRTTGSLKVDQLEDVAYKEEGSSPQKDSIINTVAEQKPQTQRLSLSSQTPQTVELIDQKQKIEHIQTSTTESATPQVNDVPQSTLASSSKATLGVHELDHRHHAQAVPVAVNPSAQMSLPRRGPRDPRGGDLQVARFGALEISLRRCPEGEGKIGSEHHEGRAEEKPIHYVKFESGFWLSEAPITQLQWMAVMRQNPSQFIDPYRPVDGVSWLDAATFCNRMSAAYHFTPAYEIVDGGQSPLVYWREDANGFRLPTEAEWEYAARANSSDVNHLYTHERLNDAAWYRDNSGGETRPIGSKKPNDWGFFDLCGDVWEWCHDEWTRSAYAERSPMASEGTADPMGPVIWNPVVYRPDLRHKVARGGSFADSASNCRLACRGRLEVFGRRYAVGLRLCLPHDTRLEA